MISLKELLNGHKIEECTVDQRDNLNILLERVNKLRAAWGKPIKVTSGLRTFVDMERIYKSKVYPKASKHLYGQAVDFYDPDGSLMKWLKEDDSKRMREYNLWGENNTKGWVHLQIVAMGSYNIKTDLRWFNP